MYGKAGNKICCVKVKEVGNVTSSRVLAKCDVLSAVHSLLSSGGGGGGGGSVSQLWEIGGKIGEIFQPVPSSPRPR